MKYEDDELAEAALFLAHHADDRPARVPASLERELAASGARFAAGVRSSTTKSAVVTLDQDVEHEREAPRGARAWVGWLAAAAAVALVVYGMRSATLPRAPDRLAARSTVTGEPVADVVAEKQVAAVTIAVLPATGPGEEYRLWLSSGDAAQAVAAGAFSCESGCSNVRVEAPWPTGEPRALWITRAKTTDPWASLAAAGPFVARGER